MKPIKTMSTNCILRPAPGTEDTVYPLPVTVNEHGVASCWQMTWRDRFRVFRTGRVWFHCRSNTHPPIRLTVGYRP